MSVQAKGGVSLAARSLAHVRRIIHAIHAQSSDIESRTGITGPQLWLLREIARARGGLALGEIAERLALHPANAGRLVDRLAAKGLVKRDRPERDRRVVLVRLTPAGKRRVSAPVANPPQADLLARLEALPGSELARLERALARLVELMGAEGVEPGPLFEKKG